MSKYLYGAEIHGIQSFIFSTNELKDIIGASNLINDLPKVCIQDDILKNQEDSSLPNSYELLQAAAGGIKCLFTSMEACQKLYRELPNKIAAYAPDISVTQAVVEIKGNIQKNTYDELQKRLTERRSQYLAQYSEGYMGTQISRETGFAAFQKTRTNEFQDRAVIAKKKAVNSKDLDKEYALPEYDKVSYPTDFNQLVGISGRAEKWIAVVHADGSNIGQTIREIIQAVKDQKNWETTLSIFSRKLEKATKTAFLEAIKTTFQPLLNDKDHSGLLPIRPLILGGDDVTFIIDADYAIPFTEQFLLNFQIQTKLELKDIPVAKRGFNASAGIAFTKANYPFHYGVELADALCKAAKDPIKKSLKEKQKDHPKQDMTVVPAIAFHRMKNTLFNDYKTLIEREKDFGSINMNTGPYLIGEESFGSFIPLSELKRRLKIIQKQPGLHAKLREWLNLLKENPPQAESLFQRMKQQYGASFIQLGLEDEMAQGKIAIFDLLTLYAVQKQF